MKQGTLKTEEVLNFQDYSDFNEIQDIEALESWKEQTNEHNNIKTFIWKD